MSLARKNSDQWTEEYCWRIPDNEIPLRPTQRTLVEIADHGERHPHFCDCATDTPMHVRRGRCQSEHIDAFVIRKCPCRRSRGRRHYHHRCMTETREFM